MAPLVHYIPLDITSLRAEVDALRASLPNLVDRVESRQTEEQFLRIELDHLRSLASHATLPLRIPDVPSPDGSRRYMNLQTYVQAAVRRAETVEHDLSPCLDISRVAGRVDGAHIKACFADVRCVVRKTLELFNTVRRDGPRTSKRGSSNYSGEETRVETCGTVHENIPTLSITSAESPPTSPASLSHSEGIGFIITKHAMCTLDTNYLTVPTPSGSRSMPELRKAFPSTFRASSALEPSKTTNKTSSDLNRWSKDLPPTPESVYCGSENSLAPPPQKMIRSRTNVSPAHRRRRHSTNGKAASSGPRVRSYV